MKISICIPQYNRIDLLLRSLKTIEEQTYDDIEVVVSDDCSTDQTQEEILKLQQHYRYPIKYFRFDKNQGYDRNYRKCIELATGDYCFVIGNDDTVIGEKSIQQLAGFLKENPSADIGYCNFIEESQGSKSVERALKTGLQGSGIETAIKHANGFSFVGGLIYKKESFNKFNTDAHDGSIYAQMYIGLLMIARGCNLFTYRETIVLKDLQKADGTTSWSPYKNGLPKNWKEFKIINSGLLGVMNVLIAACKDAGQTDGSFIFKIMKRSYCITLPYWILQYKHFGSYAAGAGLIAEMYPPHNKFYKELNFGNKMRINFFYFISSVGGILFPFRLFKLVEKNLHKAIRN